MATMKDYYVQLMVHTDLGTDVDSTDAFKASSVANMRARLIKQWGDKLINSRKNTYRDIRIYQSAPVNGYGIKGEFGYIGYWKGGAVPKGGAFVWTVYDKKTLMPTHHILNRDGTLGRRL